MSGKDIQVNRRRICVGRKRSDEAGGYNMPGYDCAVKLLRSELVYDIDFISWKVAKCRISETAESRAEAQTDEESADWLDREIEVAVGNVKSELAAYVREPRMRVQTDEAESLDEWNIILEMEPGWRGNVRTLKTNIHQYVVNYVLAHWFDMVLPDEAGKYHLFSDQLLRKVVMSARDVVVTDVRFTL